MILNRDVAAPFSQYHQHFTYEFFVPMLFWQLFSSYMYIEKAAEMTFIRKIRMLNVDEIDTLSALKKTLEMPIISSPY